MFSQTAEYALRVVAYLATLDGEPATTKQVAAATRVPEGYLAKVIGSLSKAGVLTARRGLHGGSALARPADEITIYDVMQAVAPLPRIRTCPLGIKSHGTTLCPVHRRLDGALAMVEQAFRESTIAALVADSSGSPPLCDPDRPAVTKMGIKRKKPAAATV